MISLGEIHPRTFSSADIEALSGISPLQQRDWRRRGFFEFRERKHGRYTLIDAARALALKRLATGGVGPGRGAELAKEASASAVWFALDDYSAWDLRGPRDRVTAYIEFLGSDDGHLARQQVCGITADEIGRYAISFSAGPPVLTSDIGSAFEAARDEMGVVLDVEGLGRRLAVAGGALVTVHLDGDVWGKNGPT